MQSILISSKDKNRGREEAEKFFKKIKIDTLDITVLEHEKAVGIADVREIRRKIYLSPIRSDFKAVLIDATLGITTEAQNALLKTLEEPPESTYIIVQVTNSEDLLPTILSRCKVYEIKSDVKQTDVSKVLKTLNLENGVGEKLKLAQDLSKDSPRFGEAGKNEALDFLEKLILTERKKLIDNPVDYILIYKSLRLIQKFYTIIKTTNVNLRLALENLFLNL